MARISYNEIVDTAMAAISEDPAISEWCMTTYGKPIAVYNDLDPINPPREEDCPLVCITPMGGEMGQDRGTFLRGFMVKTCVSDSGVTIIRDETTNRIIYKKYLGTERVSYLHEVLIYKALCSAFNSRNYPVSTSDEESETVNDTLFELRAGITVEMEKAIGEEVPLLG